MPVIVIDAMGGDFAPQVTVAGSLKALAAHPGLTIKLVGKEEMIRPLLTGDKDVLSRAEIIDAREVIETAEAPVMALRKKADSSLVRAFQILREGGADALVSAGSTGAVMAASMFRLGRIPGIDRPALGALLPTIAGKPCLLMDVGANVDCQPEWLLQFAKMGSQYTRFVTGIENPRVALLSNGEEAEKGNQQVKAAHELLAQAQGINFIGNLEARGVPMGETDVIIADGFAGNILLKSMEGISKAIFRMLKAQLTSTTTAKIGALLVKKPLSQMKTMMDADEVGGAPLLGTLAPVVKAHGNSKEHAYYRAIEQAMKIHESGVVRAIAEAAQQ